MKILHAADLHAGLVSHSRLDPATGLPSRLLDVDAAMGRIVELAIERRIDLVVLAGDTFHDANPSAASLALFAARLRELRLHRIPVHVLAGNHDRAPHPRQPSVLETFDDRPIRVAVSTTPEIVDLGGLRVAALPSVSRHEVMASERYATALEGDEAVRDGLRRIVGEFSAYEDVDVLSAHWPVAGALLGGERDIALIPEPMLDQNDLVGPWAWVALGHIHRSQTLALVGAYAGSPTQMNFGEEGQQKGVWIVDVEDPEAAEFVEIGGRHFVTLANGDEYPPDIEGAIVRVRGSSVDDEPRIARELEARGVHSFRLIPPERPRASARAPELAERLDPRVAFDAWAERNVDDDDRERLAGRVEQLLSEPESEGWK